MTLHYFELSEGRAIPDLSKFAPYRCLLLSVGGESADYRSLVADMIVNSGCLYFMAWGDDCELWHDWVDETVIEEYIVNRGLSKVPDDALFMTTWHNEPLKEAMYFAKFCATDCGNGVQLEALVFLNIGTEYDETKLRAMFENVKWDECN